MHAYKTHFCFTAKYTVYDGMAFPEEQPKSIFKWIGDAAATAAKKLFSRQDGSDVSIPSHDLAQRQCLVFFLESYKNVLQNLEFKKVPFIKLVNDICIIFQQLRIQQLCQQNSRSDEKRIADGLPKV